MQHIQACPVLCLHAEAGSPGGGGEVEAAGGAGAWQAYAGAARLQ